MAGNNPIFSLPHTVPWLNTVYYADRTMPETDPEKIIAHASQWNGPIYVLARYQSKDWQISLAILQHIAAATDRDMKQVNEFNDGLGLQRLYQFQRRPLGDR